MMARWARYGSPGPEHTFLERMVGEWDLEMRVSMPGAQPTKGKATGSWLMEGRWLKMESNTVMMGMPLETFSIMGYDKFKMSYVATSVSTMDTAMNSSEGDLDPGGEVLLLYGTVDEYLTGEHDKMVKTIYRFESADEFVMEVHDLPIGLENTKVVEIRFTRAK